MNQASRKTSRSACPEIYLFTTGISGFTVADFPVLAPMPYLFDVGLGLLVEGEKLEENLAREQVPAVCLKG